MVPPEGNHRVNHRTEQCKIVNHRGGMERKLVRVFGQASRPICETCGDALHPCFGSQGGDPGRRVTVKRWWCRGCGRDEAPLYRERALTPEHFEQEGGG